MKNFTSELVDRMLPAYFNWPAVRVGVVLFGNGMLIKQTVNGEEKLNQVFERDLRTALENRFYNNSGDCGVYMAQVLIEVIG